MKKIFYTMETVTWMFNFRNIFLGCNIFQRKFFVPRLLYNNSFVNFIVYWFNKSNMTSFSLNHYHLLPLKIRMWQNNLTADLTRICNFNLILHFLGSLLKIHNREGNTIRELRNYKREFYGFISCQFILKTQEWILKLYYVVFMTNETYIADKINFFSFVIVQGKKIKVH